MYGEIANNQLAALCVEGNKAFGLQIKLAKHV